MADHYTQQVSNMDEQQIIRLIKEIALNELRDIIDATVQEHREDVDQATLNNLSMQITKRIFEL